MKKGDKMTRLEDIATRCGVSVSTVSRVLNNAPGISTEVRRRVLEVAQAHDFTVQKRRRSLSRTQLKLMIVIPDEREIAVNPFFDMTELLNAINAVFVEDWKQIEVITFTQFRAGAHAKSLHADGIILAFGTIDRDTAAFLEHKSIPFVFLNRTERNYVANNNYKGMLRLGEYLAEKGKRRIGYLGCRLSPINRDRFRGYLTAQYENPHRFERDLVYEVDAIDGIGSESAAFFLDRGCEAVMCFNDNFAIRLIGELTRMGKNVPGDLSITGFDDAPMRRIFRPLITTISLSTYEMGFYAARWLKDNIVNRSSRSLKLEVEGELLEGETVL